MTPYRTPARIVIRNYIRAKHWQHVLVVLRATLIAAIGGSLTAFLGAEALLYGLPLSTMLAALTVVSLLGTVAACVAYVAAVINAETDKDQ